MLTTITHLFSHLLSSQAGRVLDKVSDEDFLLACLRRYGIYLFSHIVSQFVPAFVTLVLGHVAGYGDHWHLKVTRTIKVILEPARLVVVGRKLGSVLLLAMVIRTQLLLIYASSEPET